MVPNRTQALALSPMNVDGCPSCCFRIPKSALKERRKRLWGEPAAKKH